MAYLKSIHYYTDYENAIFGMGGFFLFDLGGKLLKFLGLVGEDEIYVGIVVLILIIVDIAFFILSFFYRFVDKFEITFNLPHSSEDKKLPKAKEKREILEKIDDVLADLKVKINRDEVLAKRILYLQGSEKERLNQVLYSLEDFRNQIKGLEYYISKQQSRPFRKKTMRWDATIIDVNKLVDAFANVEKELDALYKINQSRDPELNQYKEQQKKREEQQRQKNQQRQQQERKERQEKQQRREQKQSQRSSSTANENTFFEDCNDLETLNARYKKLVKVCHPDSGIGSEETFKRLQEEYERCQKKLS